MNASQRAILANSQLTLAEKNAALLLAATAYKSRQYNFTQTPVPSKQIHVAGSRFATA